MTAEEWRIAGFTLQMAAMSTLLILPPGLLLGWLLARRNWFAKSVIETLVTLPIVMPPVATGCSSSSSSDAAGWWGDFSIVSASTSSSRGRPS